MKEIENLQKTYSDAGPTQSHSCSDCTNFRCIVERYEKLIELLYKKIRKLQAKSKLVYETNRSSIEIEEKQGKIAKLSISKQFEEKLLAVYRVQKEKEQQPVLCKKIDNIESDSKQNKKISFTEKMGEAIMQLKTNLLHIRSCVYFVFREANVWKITEKNETVKDIMEVLFNIFQYSESERDEICRVKKVKLRRIEKKSDTKQNIYITVKEI